MGWVGWGGEGLWTSGGGAPGGEQGGYGRRRRPTKPSPKQSEQTAPTPTPIPLTAQVVDALEDALSAGGCVVEAHSCDFFPERWFDLVVVLQVGFGGFLFCLGLVSGVGGGGGWGEL